MSTAIRYSILDLAPIVTGGTAAQSLQNTLDLARHAEKWGYNRYWIAEHHNMPGIASSATSLVISHVAAGTTTIRVGSGGIMLPNHSPLVIAEQFGTLESLYPGRIDLGLGRAPGSDQQTARAIRRSPDRNGQDFPNQLHELRAYFDPSGNGYDGVHAVPGEGSDIPIWLLGSSGFSAELAGRLGLPFAFASHFAPEYLMQALELYRTSFSPSDSLEVPYTMVGLNVIAADTDEEAEYLSTSHLQQFLGIIQGKRGQLKPPVASMDDLWSPYEKEMVQKQLSFTVKGSKSTIARRIQEIISATGANEIIVTAQIFDHAARLRSYEILADAMSNQNHE